jgi:hypothetical protein
VGARGRPQRLARRRTGQVMLLLGFQLLSFAVAVAVWLAAPRDR